MGDPVTHFEILGKDAGLLQKFYAAAFGWQIRQQFPGYAMVVPGADAGINGGIGAAPGGGHVTLYVEVDDLSGALQRITGLGGKVAVPTSDIPGGPLFAMIHDPEGHLIGLVQADSRGGNRHLRP